jgi:hypothetical protein
MISVLLVACCSVFAYPQSQNSKSIPKVSLEVTADDPFKDEVTKLINKELQALGDLELVDSDPDLQIEILALKNENTGGFFIGYTLSICVTRKMDSAKIRNILSTQVKNQEQRKLLLDSLTNQDALAQHSILVGTDLEKLCKNAVADIDSDVIK